MATIFDGKLYSLKKQLLLKSGAKLLKEKGKNTKLATILVGNDSASRLYINLKKKYIEEIGLEVDVYNLPETVKKEEIDALIDSLNTDKNVNGIMIQLPLPESLKSYRDELIEKIEDSKDVDGMKKESKFIPPTVKAVLEILSLARNEVEIEIENICVVGATGIVGKSLVKELKKRGNNVLEVDENTKNLEDLTKMGDVVISATGVINLISPDMIKQDVILIDVGSPFGDIDPRCSDTASFLTPVPGGVGPVTISCLAENLLLITN